MYIDINYVKGSPTNEIHLFVGVILNNTILI